VQEYRGEDLFKGFFWTFIIFKKVFLLVFDIYCVVHVDGIQNYVDEIGYKCKPNG